MGPACDSWELKWVINNIGVFYIIEGLIIGLHNSDQ